MNREEAERRDLLRRIEAGKREAAKRFWTDVGREEGRKQSTRPARAKRSEETADHMRRAVVLHDEEGLTPAAIGHRIAREDGRKDEAGNVRPYDSGVVRRWLRKSRTD